MQERRAAAQIAQDEQWLLDRLRFVSRKENVIQEETEPVDQLSDRPDGVKQYKKNNSFACQTGGGVL
jgi:hypothetical protein